MKKIKFSALLYCSALLLSHENIVFGDAVKAFNVKDLPSPYNDLTNVLPFNGHGWYVNGQWLEKLITTNNVVNIVEVGSWLGASTRHIASLLPKNGMVYAVDVWEETVELVQHVSPNAWSSIKPIIYEQFLSNVVHAGLTHKIIPMKMTSQEAATVLATYEKQFDLVYIDAAHDTISVTKDLDSYFPFVVNNKGILCGDDWGWASVRTAVFAFAEKQNLTIYADGNFWFLKDEGQYKLCSFLQACDEAWKF